MKCGLKTIPLPIDDEDEIKLIETEFGLKGWAVMIKLKQFIGAHGYYIKWDIDTQLLFMREKCLTAVGQSVVSEVVACAVRRGVFNAEMYKKHGILTSNRIQETFLTAMKRSTKVIFDKDYALPVVYDFIQNVNRSGKNANIIFKNVCSFEQKKGKEKKEKEIDDDTIADVLGVIVDCQPEHTEAEYKQAAKALSESIWAKNNMTHLSKIHRHWDKLITGYYKDRPQKTGTVKTNNDRHFTGDEINAMFNQLTEEDV